MKIENVYIRKMSMNENYFTFVIETTGFDARMIADNTIRIKADILAPVDSELSNTLFDKLRNREKFSIEIGE